MLNQKPNAKKWPLKDELLQKVYSWSDWLTGKVAVVTRNWEKMRDITKNNFELGKLHFQLGNITDAIFRFKVVTWLEPKYVDAWFFLGTSYMADGDMKMAKKALAKALELEPNYEEALYMMAIAKGKEAKFSELPSKMPITLARSHFDSVASNYTREQLEVLEYQGHILLCTAIRSCLLEGRVDHEVVDLGVGTGLCGPLLRNVSSRLIGVDISSAMLEEAMKQQDERGKKIYDILLNKEMTEFLKESPDSAADIILSATAFSYVGDLSEIFHQVSRVLRHGGIFAFTVDPELVGDFKLDTTAGRFCFSQAYLKRLADDSGLTQVRMEEVPAYPDFKMLLCVFSK